MSSLAQGPGTPDDRFFRSLFDRVELPAVVMEPLRDESGVVVDFTIVHANEAVRSLPDLSRGELTGRRITELPMFAPGSVAHLACLRVFDTSTAQTIELSLPDDDGGAVVELTSTRLGDRLVAWARDVTSSRNAQTQLLEAVTHDPLTGLANRVALIDEINRALGSARRSGQLTAVLMLDLDHFKDVNDALGHAVGDELLRIAARRIESVVRAGDLVARQGGDEFVIVMRDMAAPAEALRLSERIVDQFRTSITVDGSEAITTASLGVAFALAGASTPDDLLREADTAMYLAKSGGRDRYSIYDDALRQLADEREAIECELRGALEDDQFAVWYQPEVNLDGGAVHAVEALLRWRHPSGEIVPAERFISITSDNGQIVEIGMWAIEQACEQAARWAASHPAHPVTVRINLSTLQLSEPGFLDDIDNIIARTGVDPQLLAVEVTEGTLLRQVVAIHDNLIGLHERGIKIAFEHFGTGYASLALLRDLPISMLRLDSSFVHAIVEGRADRRLVAGVLALSRQLGLAVSAEGVETAEQAELLRRLGCVAAQGFLYSPAVPAAQVTPGGPVNDRR